jgi:tripartite ATP-independent transporter DctM subunit
LFFGAFLPGLVLSALYCLYVVGVCVVKPQWAPAVRSKADFAGEPPFLFLMLKGFIPPVILIMGVLGSIFLGWATPTEAAGVGAFLSILLALFNGRFNGGMLKDVLERTALTTGMIFFILIGATTFSYVFRSLGGDDFIIAGIEALGLGSWGLLWMLMGVIFVLGFCFDWVEITLILLPVFAPIVQEMDFGEHIARTEVVYWFALLVAVNLQTSFLTPPFGFTLFYLRGITPPAIRIQDIYMGIVPFVVLQLIGLVVCILWPDIPLWLPRLAARG